MQIVVVGAGVGGLGAALALSRDGHEVTLLERDATPLPANPDEAFAWDRRGAPQVRHSHALLARLRNLLRDRFPDVLADLLAAGATELRFADEPPPGMEGWSPEPGDEDLVALACRRTTFEWVLRRSVLAAPHVSLVDGVGVDGVRFTPGATVPTVTGVAIRADGGAPSVIAADAVVVATGRRSVVPDWLAAGGVTVPEHTADTGIVYFSRFYRLLDGVEPPPRDGPIGGDLGYLKYAVFDGDNRTFSITLACATDDTSLRQRFGAEDGFTATAGALTYTAPWIAPTLAEPITGVHLMAGLVNRRRRFLDDAGRPTVSGLHAVGDAHTCTNPLYGRGCSLAMVQAALLADATRAHPDDPLARALDYEQASEREVLPWYRAAVAQDGVEGEGDDDDGGGGAPGMSRDQFRDLLRDGLMPAVRTDPHVFRAFIRSFNLLEPPAAMLADPIVIGRALEAYQERDTRPPEPALGPDRDALLATP